MGSLDILMIVSEALPFSKTGGLGDVGGALPLALGRLGHRVTLVLPRYRDNAASPWALRLETGPERGAPSVGVVEQSMAPGVRAWLVDYPPYFDRDGIYGSGTTDFADNDRRFSLLARAALDAVAASGTRPDVVHAHDWQAGLAPAYLKGPYATHPLLSGVPSVFTIHNLAYQGLFPKDSLAATGLGWEAFTDAGAEFWGKLSFLKAGINFASVVTTVSRRYAEEIKQPELGFGFDGGPRGRAAALLGIRNGIDTQVWDPSADPFLPAPFSAADLRGKATAKQELLARFGMRSAEQLARPTVGMISRMVDQKGLDLIFAASADLMQSGANFVILGTGEDRYQNMWRDLGRRYPDRVAATIGFDEGLAHQIEAGADIFLMPSRFEPCGLNQMYSLRYGTVPVVRATGGLDDTVTQVDSSTGVGNGFKFNDHTPEAMLTALWQALVWYRRPEAWRQIQVSGMREDNSWESAAAEYVAAYRRAIAESGRAGDR